MFSVYSSLSTFRKRNFARSEFFDTPLRGSLEFLECGCSFCSLRLQKLQPHSKNSSEPRSGVSKNSDRAKFRLRKVDREEYTENIRPLQLCRGVAVERYRYAQLRAAHSS